MQLSPFLAFFFSGASSLIFESIWTRMLHHVFGSTAVAMSTVLSVFMAGLGLGAWLFGRYADRIKHPLITYAVAEIMVGLCGLIVPYLVASDGWLASLNGWMRVTWGAQSTLFAVARFVAVVPILIVPTTLMGSTLPLLARHFVEVASDAKAASARIGTLYAINTFGAVGGVFLSGFILLPNIGLTYTNFAAVVINISLGSLILIFRKRLLGDALKEGESLQFLPSKAPTASEAEAAQESPPQKAAPVDREAEGYTDPIPAIARKLAFVAFGASGAAALCAEVVWTRALASVIGSSIYSFTLILMTFLIGIAGGSAYTSAVAQGGKRALYTVAVMASVLVFIANAPAAVGARDGATTYTLFTVGGLALIAVVLFFSIVASRNAGEFRKQLTPQETTIWAFGILAVPCISAVIHSHYTGPLSKIICSVVSAICLFLAISLAVRRSLVLLLALIQLLIAACTFVNYIWADEIPLGFASLVASMPREMLADHVGRVQFFMFFTAGLCTLPACLGMGAMFPVTVRVWTAGGAKIARDVSRVYTANTVGSIVGAWLPGFILLPWIGMERTLLIGVALNLILALMMLIATAAEPPSDAASSESIATDKSAKSEKASGDDEGEKKAPSRELPIWQAATIYILAPLIPALGALGFLGAWRPNSYLSWNLSQMTLGVFRVSIAKDVLNPETWGEPDLVFYHDGLSTTVSVERWGHHYALKNNGKVDASNGDDIPTQVMVGGYPLLMHQNGPRNLDVAIIGFGSGMTVGTTLKFPVRSVQVVELERSIPDASRYFQDVNNLEYPLPDFPFVRMPRLEVINDDGRNYLAATNRQFDIIMSEPSNPWITGVSDLFTVDHFSIAKQRLRPGGIYCQWVQLYELSPENIKTIYRTIASQFRYAVVFAAENMSSDTVVLGSDSPLPLDLNRVRRAYEIPGIAAEMERAHIHSPFDVFSRVLLANREEILDYTQLEYHRVHDDWIADPASSNAGTCPAGQCRRDPAPLNTDDNALIEFAAPKDLIGFMRYEGYLSNIYSPEWPYAQLRTTVRGFGTGDEAARNYAEQALSLIASGRKTEAAEFIQRSQQAGNVRETAVALETLAMLMSEQREPRISIEPPIPGPQMDARTAERLTTGFDAVKHSVDAGAYHAALEAMEEIPAPIRLHSGPSMRFLYGYLLYKGAEGETQQYRNAIEQLEELVRSDIDYVVAHPEIYYFLARAHDAQFDYEPALTNMRLYVELRVVPRTASGTPAQASDAPTPAADGAAASPAPNAPLPAAPAVDQPAAPAGASQHR